MSFKKILQKIENCLNIFSDSNFLIIQNNKQKALRKCITLQLIKNYASQNFSHSGTKIVLKQIQMCAETFANETTLCC